MGLHMKRRTFLRLAAGAVALPALPRFVQAQAYPTRPVRIVVPAAAGGVADVVARLVARPLSDRLGRPFIIENRAGGGTIIGTEFVIGATPDGYTLLLLAGASVIAPLVSQANFSIDHDIAAVASIVRIPHVLVVNPSVPAKTVPELITYLKSNPNKITMASAGIGSLQHLAGELFNVMAQVRMLHVPYRGEAPALTDLVGGQVQVMVGSVPGYIEQIKVGGVRALAVTTPSRLEALPDLPTVADCLPGYEAVGWNGIGAPKKTPPQIIEKVNGEINAALAEPELRNRLADLGGAAMTSSANEFGKFISEETEKWAKVVRFANIKPD
jgi:tripartite-type tricarboxylate transporter receptor subunit TctC